MLLPRVSVIIPTFNRPGLLREALKSVSEQIFTDYEIIVVDDGSSVPGVEEVCLEFPKCRYYFQENRGPSAARNRGIIEARGEFIALLDDDDRWKPGKLDSQVKFLDQHSEIGMVHGPAEVIDDYGGLTGEVIGTDNIDIRRGRVFRFALRWCVVKSPTPIVRRQILKECGLFDENPCLLYYEDHEFWARFAYRNEFGYIPEPMAYYRVHERPRSYQNQKRALDVHLYIARKLCKFVEPEDRLLVRKQCCKGYFDTIDYSTSIHSIERLLHLLKVIRLWPPCISDRNFWKLLLQ
jgi:glycosyltransferase involved in cell wall biosynthesis